MAFSNVIIILVLRNELNKRLFIYGIFYSYYTIFLPIILER